MCLFIISQWKEKKMKGHLLTESLWVRIIVGMHRSLIFSKLNHLDVSLFPRQIEQQFPEFSEYFPKMVYNFQYFHLKFLVLDICKYS